MILFRYLLLRLAAAVLTLFGAVALLFVLMQLVPGDLITIMFGPRATPELRAAYEARMALDQPLPEQFGIFLVNATRGDFGQDILSNRPILAMLVEVLPNTLRLAAAGLLLALAGGISFGVLAARHPGSKLDTILGMTSVAFITTPSFVVSIGLLLLFAIGLGWFPVTGAGTQGDPLSQIHHLVLPAFALAIGWVGYLARLVRASMLEVLTENHIRMMRAYGVPERRITWKYALRPAIVPMVAVMGIGVGDLISNAVFVEIIFSRPGVGTLIYNAIEDRNFPVVQAGILFTVFIYVTANLIVELVTAFLDPRIARNLVVSA